MGAKFLKFLKILERPWAGWTHCLEKKPLQSLLGLSLYFSLLWFLISFARHDSLHSNAFDLGIFTNAAWNLIYQGEYISSFKQGMNLFADHQSPILWLYAQIFRIWPSPIALLLLQSLILSTGAGAVYVLGKQAQLSKEHLAFLPWAYLLYPAIRKAAEFDFHPETAILPAFLWGLAFLQSQRWRWLSLGFFALGLAGKESAGPLLFGIGVSLTLIDRKVRTIGLFMMGCAVIHFYFTTSIVPRFFEGGTYEYMNLFSHLGDSPVAVMLSPFTKPNAFLQSLLGFAELKFVLFLLIPLACLPLFSWRHLIASVPSLLILMLPQGDRLGLSFHYGIEPAVGMFWALAPGLRNARIWTQSRLQLQQFVNKRKNFFSPLWLTLWVILSLVGIGQRLTRYQSNSHIDWLKEEVIANIDARVSLSAPSHLAAHLATRPWALMLPLLQTKDGGFVDCIFWDSSLKAWPMDSEQSQENFQAIEERFDQVYQCGSFMVFVKPGNSLSSCFPNQIPSCKN